ncbi:hypothetical protein J437_LFUL002445 [Ladona fulva]|uniref:Coiled-coil protein 142 C-terminal domain-containing protein n=1 Tax=Ladona fulva TaxID=123851 RepID=A0A8K0KQ50_LADFU|nr:hypothetical protein J437_LFUL002445 [Ladona fulva]
MKARRYFLVCAAINKTNLDVDFHAFVKEVQIVLRGFKEAQDMYDIHLSEAIPSIDHITLCRAQQSCLLVSKSRTSLCYLINRLILGALPVHEAIEPILLLARLHDGELHRTLCGNDCKASDLCSNTCPILIRPLRHLSLARMLSFVARGQGDICGHKIVTTLLQAYAHDLKLKCNFSSEEESFSEGSHATSIEICRDLTRNVTPPLPPVAIDKNYGKPYPQLFQDSNFFVPSFNAYYLSEQEGLELALVEKILKDSAHLENNFVAMNTEGPVSADDTTGTVSGDSLSKAIAYFSQNLWGEVSSVIDSVTLWWIDGRNNIESLLDIEQMISGGTEDLPLAIHSPEATLRLRDWLQELITTYGSSNQIPGVMAAAVQSLCDGVSSHIMTVAWDHSFRMALVQPNQEEVSSGAEKGTYTGRLFVEVLRRLVSLSNDWEDRGILESADIKSVSSYGHPKDREKSRKEGACSFAADQIPVLHRLDHSLHTLRMWVQAYTRKAASNWNALSFFCAAHSDVMSALEVLKQLRLPDNEQVIDVENVNMTVCMKMRSKLVSEVKANVVKLQNLPAECLKVLAMMGRTVSLATLCLCMPDPRYWRRRSNALPEFPSPYVEEYLDKVLKPVIKAVQNLDLTVQQSAAGMILRILGEAWLDHIYQHRIKFSEWGALQLLTDFGSVQTWLEERITLSPELHRHLAQTEVLRRCEGVGRLLLRHPGEAISMVPPSQPKPAHRQRGSFNGCDDSPISNSGGHGPLMPAEMYVPNQEQWLELRASGARDCCRSCCNYCWSPVFCALCLLSCR